MKLSRRGFLGLLLSVPLAARAPRTFCSQPFQWKRLAGAVTFRGHVIIPDSTVRSTIAVGPGAFLQTMNAEMNALVADMKRGIERDLFHDGETR